MKRLLLGFSIALLLCLAVVAVLQRQQSQRQEEQPNVTWFGSHYLGSGHPSKNPESEEALLNISEIPLEQEVAMNSLEGMPQRIKKSATPDNKTLLELRSSAFFHTGNTFRDIYGDVTPTFGAEITQRIGKRHAAWIDLDYLREKHSEDCCNSSLGILNISFGAKYIHPLGNRLESYIGIGPSFSWVDLHNHSCCIDESFTRVAVGGLLKTGFYYQLSKHYFIDIFADYLYQTVEIGHSIDIGGLKVGLGIGTKF